MALGSASREIGPGSSISLPTAARRPPKYDPSRGGARDSERIRFGLRAASTWSPWHNRLLHNRTYKDPPQAQGRISVAPPPDCLGFAEPGHTQPSPKHFVYRPTLSGAQVVESECLECASCDRLANTCYENITAPQQSTLNLSKSSRVGLTRPNRPIPNQFGDLPGTFLAKSDRIRPKVGHARPNIDRNRHTVGHHRAEFGRDRSNSAGSANLGQHSKAAPDWSKSDNMSPIWAGSCPDSPNRVAMST